MKLKDNAIKIMTHIIKIVMFINILHIFQFLKLSKACILARAFLYLETRSVFFFKSRLFSKRDLDNKNSLSTSSLISSFN